MIHAIQHVCRTFSTDPVGSAALLRPAIELGHLKAHGSEELRWIAQSVPSLVAHDPDLVRECIEVRSHDARETRGGWP